ncbi:ABC transporter ATP-binding protein [Viridibacillus sp. FSL R5-0477]|uniref:Putative ABC transporter (ATP-binding protein) n=1 Tax=Viridibacillus arenosi FSL R5-213 TaxID=1227360 RepID=W4EJV6_9BACL|nr:ABC transporter ATP-binding protein [Viridibacillus arenosi]ETT80878.1 putative ABC transporter (ATP-binding protein) [Viridibacillus arenosi FSL R5-213]OMC93001.1 molybdenum ABC transporter ATP-binding protein [Viridibacillus arenosi]
MVLHMKEVCLKREGQWILENINWQIEKGEHWVLYGLNGAGKSALLNMLCSYYFPTKGDLKVVGRTFGKSVLGEELRRKIGLVSSGLQQKLNPNDSAFEIVLSGAFASIGLYEKPTPVIREKAISILKKLGSIEYADRDYQTLSQGEKQRILIGRALMDDPELLILDEPATGFDFIAREQLLKTIGEIAALESGPTIIYVTHHIEEILPVFQKTLLLKKGQVFASGSTIDMLTSEKLSSFFDIPVEVIWYNNRPLLSKQD